MIPDVPTILNGIARCTAMEIGPEMRSQYGTWSVQLIPVLLMMVAQEFDRAAARLTEENETLVGLFKEANTLVTDETLRRDLAEAAAAGDSSLMVSALRERNHRLRALLIRLHGHVETLAGSTARAFDDRLWAELVASTRRRHLDLAIA